MVTDGGVGRDTVIGRKRTRDSRPPRSAKGRRDLREWSTDASPLFPLALAIGATNVPLDSTHGAETIVRVAPGPRSPWLAAAAPGVPDTVSMWQVSRPN